MIVLAHREITITIQFSRPVVEYGIGLYALRRQTINPTQCCFVSTTQPRGAACSGLQTLIDPPRNALGRRLSA